MPPVCEMLEVRKCTTINVQVQLWVDIDEEQLWLLVVELKGGLWLLLKLVG